MGYHFTISVDGQTLVDMTDPQVYDPSKMSDGVLGLYEEVKLDSFDNIKLTKLLKKRINQDLHRQKRQPHLIEQGYRLISGYETLKINYSVLETLKEPKVNKTATCSIKKKSYHSGCGMA